ncbi:TPA: hypothetical protein I1507_002521, partial [Staphylococcus pseudintermedius]|nr:hypothetical protein [Staphylococcus pseudintermedius]HAR5783780.1 hypothetical protein [Staphylococcus pseudintermedius]
ESTVDTNVLAPSLVVLPFDASLLNEFTADTNSLASVLTASLVDVDADVLADVDALADVLIDPCTDLTTDSNSDGVPLFDALSFNESTVDTNVLAPSLVVLPFDASLLNELTADTNSLASVLTASLVDVDADVLADVDALADTLIDPCTDFTTDSNSDGVPLFDALSF